MHTLRLPNPAVSQEATTQIQHETCLGYYQTANTPQCPLLLFVLPLHARFCPPRPPSAPINGKSICYLVLIDSL